jgi:hypothetical protein
MKVIDRQFVYLSSKNRIAGDKSEFLIQLAPTLLSLNDPSMFYKIWVSQLVCQNDFDIISRFTDCLEVDGIVKHLPHGKPTYTDLVKNLGALLPLGASVSHRALDNQLIFSTQTPFVMDLRVSNSCFEVIGFQKDVYTITDGFTSPEKVNIDLQYDLLYVQSNLTENIGLQGATSFPSRILAQVPVITPPYSKIVYTDEQGSYGVYVRNIKTLQDIRLTLTDELSIPMAINSDVYLVLGIETLQNDTMILQQKIDRLLDAVEKQTDLQKLQLLGQQTYVPMDHIA